MENFVLIDAYAHIYRCYFAIMHLTNSRGEPVNALYGIARMMLNLENDEKFSGRYGAVVFDSGCCSRRCGILPTYKAQRPPMPEELRDQLGKIRQWFEAFGWPMLSLYGVEADDLIAAMTRHAGDNVRTAILSKDKDLAQLVSENVTLYASGKGGEWNPLEIGSVREKFGVDPKFILDYLALIGDTADNIPGVEGVGPKTAAKLINEYGGIDDILGKINEISNAKLREKLAASVDLLHRNMELVRLDDILPEGWNGVESVCRKSPDWDKILQLANDENFKSLVVLIEKKIKERECAKKTSAPQQLTFDF